VEESEHTAKGEGEESSRGGCGGAGGPVWQPGGGVKRKSHAHDLAEWASPQPATIYLGHEHCKGG
jgi:hypothetical protein